MRRALLGMLALLAVPLAAQDDLDTKVRKALARARPVLLEQLSVAAGGPLALSCLAALHDGVPHDDPTFAAAIRRLSQTKLDGTYELALRLMVMSEMREYPHRASAAKRDAKRLLTNQKNGGFGYGRGGKSHWDLSNSQYGALGMRAAASLGCKIPSRSWRALQGRVLAVQTKYGGFTYGSRGNPYPSMTVAGIAILEICQQHLNNREARVKHVQSALRKAWAWMDDNASSVGDPRTRWTYYFHYGLERAGVLSNVQRVGRNDWYRTGAAMLVDLQTPSGGWPPQARVVRKKGPRVVLVDPISTAFAILFLRRKFQRLLGPVTQGSGYAVRSLPEQASDAEIRSAVALARKRGLRAVPELLTAMHGNVTSRRRAAALALVEISGKDFGYDPYAGPDDNEVAMLAAERWWMTEGRKRLHK